MAAAAATLAAPRASPVSPAALGSAQAAVVAAALAGWAQAAVWLSPARLALTPNWVGVCPLLR